MRLLLALLCVVALQTDTPSNTLPAAAAAQLRQSLDRSRPIAGHAWRDTAPFNPDGTVNAYIEISRGDRRKWEFDMARNRRAIDRIMPSPVGGYPVNYGYVPQTVSYDGDPFDALVLGPPIPGGRKVRGTIVGLMQMEDEKGIDSKVVLSLVGADGRPLHQLTAADQDRIGGYFKRYKLHEPGKFSKIPGWGPADQGRAFVTTTHRFFRECAAVQQSACTVR